MKSTKMKKRINLTDAKNIYKTYKSNKVKNANIIIDLLKELEGDDTVKLRKAVAVIHRIFCQLIKDGDLKELPPKVKAQKNNPKVTYNTWLNERFSEVHEQLLKMVADQEFSLHLRELSMVAVIKLIQKETHFPITKEKICNIHFPQERLKLLYATLLISDTPNTTLIKKLKEYLQSPDFVFVSLLVLEQIVTSQKDGPKPSAYLENLITLLEMITLPKQGKKALNPPKLFTAPEKEKKAADDDDSGEDDPMESSPSHEFEFPHAEGKRLFNVIWEAVLSLEFTPSMYKRCLVLFPEKVMMHLDQPITLTDFFMNAYLLGGVSSILALHGVYILITQHNLEYPKFYDHLYALFDSTIFSAKYKPRFFMLCNKFFKSPYLPEYVIAAFIKRSCRLLLTAPSSCLILLMKFVVNLLLRYPSLKRLMNNPEATGVDDDPFIADEPNPLLCRAGESSLWEVAALREHPVTDVNRSANFIFKNLPDYEHDLSKFADTTYENLYEKSRSKYKEPRIATTFRKPDGLFKYSEDTMSSCWDIL